MKPFLLSLIILTSVYAHAQTFSQKIESSVHEIAFIDLVANVEIRGTNGNDLVVSFVPASSNEQDKPSEGPASDPTTVGLKIQKGGSKINFTGTWTKYGTGKYIIDLPARLSINVQASADFTKTLKITGVKGKLDIHTEHDIAITGLANNLVLKTSSGNVTIEAEKSLRSPISIITESGNVNFTMFIKLGVTLKLGTGTGAIKAVLASQGKGLTTINATQFNSNLNGGGAVIQIQSLSGDIHLLQFK